MEEEGQPQCSVYAAQCIGSKQHEALMYSCGDALQNGKKYRDKDTLRRPRVGLH